MGVLGAVAEFAVPGGESAALTLRRSGRTVEARTAGGGMRLAVTDETRAFAHTGGADGADAVYLVVPRRRLPAAAEGLALAEGDAAALRPEARDDLLVDLAVGHATAAFCVRTGDPELQKRLRALQGAPWSAALADLGDALVTASPDRVVRTPLGRIEVYGPIPPVGARSPDGPHTHLLPRLLSRGRELPPGVDLPADLAAAAVFHPQPD